MDEDLELVEEGVPVRVSERVLEGVLVSVREGVGVLVCVEV